MKKIFVAFSCLMMAASAFANLPNEKVLRSFEQTFFGTTEVKWYDHVNYFDVSFVQKDIRANVRYDKDGNFMSSTRYYKEQQLPTNILHKLKKRYAGKSIYGVTEITNNEEINYYIKLEDSKEWLTVKVSGNGQVELYERFNKA